jgi:hypothetical protein
VIGDFPDSDGLTGKDLAEIDLAPTEAQASALRDDDGAIVEGVLERRQAGADTRRGTVEFRWVAHVQGLMGSLVVVDASEGIELGLLANRARIVLS